LRQILSARNLLQVDFQSAAKMTDSDPPMSGNEETVTFNVCLTDDELASMVAE